MMNTTEEAFEQEMVSIFRAADYFVNCGDTIPEKMGRMSEHLSEEDLDFAYKIAMNQSLREVFTKKMY